MDSYALHLAMAAMVGASFVAVSAYYMHRRTFSQLLEFAKKVERERERGRGRGDDDEEVTEKGDSPLHFRKYGEKRRSHGRRKGAGNRRTPASLPDVTMVVSADADGEEKRNGPLSLDDRNLPIPACLPRLHTLPKGQSAGRASSIKRGEPIIRPTYPKSPVASASAFESLEGSDEEDD